MLKVGFLVSPKFIRPFRPMTSARTPVLEYHQCCSAREGAPSNFSFGDVTRKSSSRLKGLSTVSRESSGKHFRSDPVRVQSTSCFRLLVASSKEFQEIVVGSTNIFLDDPAYFVFFCKVVAVARIHIVVSWGGSRLPVTEVGARLGK